MEYYTIEELKKIVEKNKPYNQIVIDAAARGEFAGIYAIQRGAQYHEALNELKKRGIKA